MALFSHKSRMVARPGRGPDAPTRCRSPTLISSTVDPYRNRRRHPGSDPWPSDQRLVTGGVSWSSPLSVS